MNTCFKNWLSPQTGYSSLFVGIITLLLPTFSNAQCFQNPDGQYVTATGEPCANTIITAVPFLRIAPDARSGGMGEAGIATATDANAVHFNASKLAFAENRSGLGLTYTPWLKSAGQENVFLGYLAGYHQLNAANTIGFGFKYFSLGDIGLTNSSGMPIEGANAKEWEMNLSYARKLSNHFSGGLGLKYIYSGLGKGLIVNGESLKAGTSIAADISFTYQNPVLTVGLALTNLGSGITYTNSINRDFLPANLGLGVAWNKKFDNNSRLTLTTDINKLLAPTPDFECLDTDRDGICDYKQQSIFSGILGSFGDAPGGFSEEIRELMFSFGAEFLFQESIAIRAGYFTEHSTKGNRKYLTTGLGYTYKSITLNGSYLIATDNLESPLDNTFRVSLLFNFGQLTKVQNK